MPPALPEVPDLALIVANFFFVAIIALQRLHCQPSLDFCLVLNWQRDAEFSWGSDLQERKRPKTVRL